MARRHKLIKVEALFLRNLWRVPRMKTLRVVADVASDAQNLRRPEDWTIQGARARFVFSTILRFAHPTGAAKAGAKAEPRRPHPQLLA